MVSWLFTYKQTPKTGKQVGQVRESSRSSLCTDLQPTSHFHAPLWRRIIHSQCPCPAAAESRVLLLSCKGAEQQGSLAEVNRAHSSFCFQVLQLLTLSSVDTSHPYPNTICPAVAAHASQSYQAPSCQQPHSTDSQLPRKLGCEFTDGEVFNSVHKKGIY